MGRYLARGSTSLDPSSTVVVVRRPRVGKGLRESSLSVSKAPHPINALPVVL